MAIPPYLLATAAQHRRKTDILVAETTVPFTTPLTYASTTPIHTQFESTGLSATVLLDIAGIYNGSPQTEQVVLSGGYKAVRSTQRWHEITQIECLSTASGTVLAVARSSTNIPIVQEQSLGTITGRLRAARLPVVEGSVQGPVLVSRHYFYTNALTLQSLDILIIDGVRYEVQDAPLIYDTVSKHHCQAVLKKVG